VRRKVKRDHQRRTHREKGRFPLDQYKTDSGCAGPSIRSPTPHRTKKRSAQLARLIRARNVLPSASPYLPQGRSDNKRNRERDGRDKKPRSWSGAPCHRASVGVLRFQRRLAKVVLEESKEPTSQGILSCPSPPRKVSEQLYSQAEGVQKAPGQSRSRDSDLFRQDTSPPKAGSKGVERALTHIYALAAQVRVLIR